MTWGRNQNPRDILQVGQVIDVKVKELDKENKRFKLSYEKKVQTLGTRLKKNIMLETW